jgi:INO80 complex subunit C
MAAAAPPTEAQLLHQETLEKLDLHSLHKPFRNPAWRPHQRRNKNIKTILLDAQKREAASTSMAATPRDESDESGASTPATAASGSGSGTGSVTGSAPNLGQASQSLAKIVLEKSLRSQPQQQQQQNQPSGALGAPGAPGATYTNIESAPSLAHAKTYCDVTGLPSPYLDPKTRLRYHNREVFALIRSLPQGVAEMYLEARGAHTVLK